MSRDVSGNDDAVRRLIDRSEIRDVVTRYFMSADRRDFVAFLDCFVPGTTVDYSDLLPVGPEETIEVVTDLIDRTMAERFGTTQHFMGNHECVLEGDTARVETYCVAMHAHLDPTTDDGAHLTSALRYVDRFARGADGRWRIAHRQAVRDLAFLLPGRTASRYVPEGDRT